MRDQMTVWSIFPGNSKYFEPSRASFMVNYIVDDLEALLDRLAKEGSVSILSAKTKATAASPGSTIPTATRSDCRSRSIQTHSSLTAAECLLA
jgi:predicted enzyme related to lactoylglutathione lyase